MMLIDKILSILFPVLNHWGYWIILIFLVISILLIQIFCTIQQKRHIFTRYHLYALIINICSLYLLSKMIEDVIDKESIILLDIWINTKVVLLWNPILDKVMILITDIIRPFHLFLLTIILLGFLIYKKRWYYSLLLTFSMIGGLLFKVLLKWVIFRARPENALIGATGYSFPSGHATMAMIFFSLVLISCKEEITNNALRYLFIAGNITLILMIGLSRVYLNVHWLSDVIAGFALGLFWVTLLILVFRTTITLSTKTLNKIKKTISNKLNFNITL